MKTAAFALTLLTELLAPARAQVTSRPNLEQDLARPLYRISRETLQQASWEFGWNLGLAIALRANDASARLVTRRLDQCGSPALKLGISVPTLFSGRGEKVHDFAAAIRFMTRGTAADLGQVLARRHGLRCAATYEFAIKAAALMLLYSQGDTKGWNQCLLQALDRAARDAGLPAAAWSTLRIRILARSSYDRVKSAVLDLGDAVPRRLGYTTVRATPASAPQNLLARDLTRPFLTEYPEIDTRTESRDGASYRSVRASSFQLGFLLAATAYRMAAGLDVRDDLERVNRVARTMGVDAPRFRDGIGVSLAGAHREGAARAAARATHCLLQVDGPRLARDMAKRRLVDGGVAAFELGLKAVVMGKLSVDSDRLSMSQEVLRLGRLSNIPHEYWQQLRSLPELSSTRRSESIATVLAGVKGWGNPGLRKRR